MKFLYIKKDKCLVKNYHLISLLPIFGKIFERVIYSSLFNYLISNKLFTPCQSGFVLWYSRIAQLLSITHKIQTEFGEKPEVNMRGIFLDISNAFDKVWHDSLLYKLKPSDVQVQLLLIWRNYLQKR